MELMEQTGIDFQRFDRRFESLVERFNSIAGGNPIATSLHEQNGNINHWLINDLLGGPHCLEIESNRNESMKQIEILQRIKMSLVMG